MQNLENNDIYQMGYKLMIQALESDSIYDVLTDVLDTIKQTLESDDIYLYRREKDELYHLFKKSSYVKFKKSFIDNFINHYYEKKIDSNYMDIDVNGTKLKKMTIININNNQSFLLLIINSEINGKNNKKQIYSILKKSMEIILKRMELYHQIKKKSESDGLTGLKNRTSFQEKIYYLNQNKHIPVTLSVLDLFRLKYINDNLSHLMGDYYIRKTAEILNKYFPDYIYATNECGDKIKQSTGDNIYRTGGDEFIIISENKSSALVEALLKFVTAEVEKLEFKGSDTFIKGINYGIAHRRDGESIEELYYIADNNLSNDKRKTYQKFGINRRQ